MKEVKVYSGSSDEDERRYAYEKAIEAYWKHVDRYHTWMNYYAIFNGALFVGFCTLLTATSNIDLWEEGKNSDITISNDYTCLQLIVCVLGIISSFCWFASLKGHSMWMKNWMRIIENYEDVKVYSLLLPTSLEFKKEKNSNLTPCTCVSNGQYKAYSTTAITIVFIVSIIIGWGAGFIYTLCKIDVEQYILILIGVIIGLSIVWLLLSFISMYNNQASISLYKFIYSDISGKEVHLKDNETFIFYN